MKSGEIYRFDDPREVFVSLFHEKTKHNPQFSIRAFSRRLGFRNPAQVADVLNGRRNLTVDFGLRVSESLDMSDEDKTYFETLVFMQNAKSPSEKSYYSTILKKLKPVDEGKKAIPPDQYAIIKEWYYGVLDEMTCLSDFRADPTYLARRLSPEVSPQAAELALSELIRIGSIEKGAKGKLTRPRKVYFKTKDSSNQLEDSILRKYQRKFIEKALIALDEQTKAESFFRMTNIPIRLRHFEELKNQIEEFVQNMGRLESSKDADEVYQLNIQFCRVTQKHAKEKE